MHAQRSINRLFASLLATTALFAAPAAVPQQPAAPAASPVYNIEVIVFRTTGAPGGEDWSARAPLRGGTGGDAAASGAKMGRFVSAIPASQFQLSDVEAKLRSSGAWQPLAHVAWSQTASPFGSRGGFAVQRLGMNVPGLSGTVFFERGQFLHLGFTLEYSSPAGPTYNLSEIRRIRFYEKNYYDHPGFGVIALVTPAQGARPAGR